jgi:hypothetical protein
VLPDNVQTPEIEAAAGAYVRKVVEHADGNVTKALTVMQASLHALTGNHAALLGAMQRLEIAQPDWLQNMRESVAQICQVNMCTTNMRHIYLKEVLSELLKRRVPTEYIVRYLDQNVRRTLREQCNLVVRSILGLLEDAKSGGDVCEEEQRFLVRQLQTIKCQLAGVCSDVSTLCAFYETRSTKSQYAVIHISALALYLVVVVGLYQNSLALTLDADKRLRVCRPYSAVHELGRLLRHSMQYMQQAEADQGAVEGADDVAKETTTAAKKTKQQPKATTWEQTAAQQMKQMCLASSTTFAGVDWKVVRAKAHQMGIDLSKVLDN